MGTRALLTEAAKALAVSDGLRLVEPHRYRAVLEHIIETRTLLPRKAVSGSWWWSSLREPVASCRPADPIGVMTGLVPPDEEVWFVIEADEVPPKREADFWLYETRIDVIASVLRELPHCEYYVVSRKCDWLLCENHHGLLIASGEPMTSRLRSRPDLDVQRAPASTRS